MPDKLFSTKTRTILLVYLLSQFYLLSQSVLAGADLAPGRKALWVWGPEPVREESARENLLALVDTRGVNLLYIDATALLMYDQQALADFIKTCQSRGIDVEFLFGKPQWALYENHHVMLTLSDQVIDFVNRHPDARPTAVHLDVEPHTLREWGESRGSVAVQLLELYRKVRARINIELPLIVDMPVWYDNFEVTRSGVSRPMHEWVIDAVHGVALMDYRETRSRVVNDAQAELSYAAATGKPILVGLETKCVDPEFITFCEEGRDEMERVMAGAKTDMQRHSSFKGYAIHDYSSYRRLQR